MLITQVPGNRLHRRLAFLTTYSNMPIGREVFLQLLPPAIYVIWSITFVVMGVYSIMRDAPLFSQPCGQSTQIEKYSLMNTVFCFFTCFTFFVFPGGGEGARARALVLTILHCAFATWGALMWMQVRSGGLCEPILNGQYKTIFDFQHICVFHNAVFFTLLVVHEALVIGGSKAIRNDYTVVPELQPAPARHAPLGPFAAPSPHLMQTSPVPSVISRVGETSKIPDIEPGIVADYDTKIFRTPNLPTQFPGVLPQGQP